MAVLLWIGLGCGGSNPYGDSIWRTRSKVASRPRAFGKDANGYLNTVQGEFENAGPLRPTVDLKRLMQSKIPTGEYRVIIGDVLEFSMPSILRVISAELTDSLGQVQPYRSRVNKAGAILLPIIGEIPAVGKTVADIEEDIVRAYYPKYVVNPPSVVGRVHEYRTSRVAILGAVRDQGVYRCSSDEMTLVSVISKAGGIVDDGATVIRIRHAGESAGRRPLVLPVKGLNIPFADVALHDGDTIEVERQNPQNFMVVGLVNKVGAFPYPAGVRYNLMQALAFAGGIDDLADPRYARIYRQGPNGKVLDRTFSLKGAALRDASNVIIKPGDVVAVEQTSRTRLRLLLAEILRINTGFNMVYRLDKGGSD